MKNNLLAPDQLQLFYRILMIQWFAERDMVQCRHLIGTDNERLRMCFGHGAGFCFGQAFGRFCRRFIVQRCFINFGVTGFKGDLQPLQQFLAVNRAGSQYDWLGIILYFQNFLLYFLTLTIKKYNMRALCLIG